MFHYPNVKWTKLQAEAMGIPQVVGATKGVKEEELEDMANTLRRARDTYRLEGICTGALASAYQKTRVEKVCKELSLQCLSPLWRIDPEEHLRKVLREGFRVMVVSVSALGLDQKWLGRILDEEAIDELVTLSKKFKFHAGLEGGEGETFVLDCPIFKEKIEVTKSATHWKSNSGTFEILGARLASKASR